MGACIGNPVSVWELIPMAGRDLTIIDDDGTGVGMSLALLEAVWLWRLVAFEGEVLDGIWFR